MNRQIANIFTGLILIANTACTALVGSQFNESVSGTTTPHPATATIIWFPPSITPSPQAFPSQQPTVEQKPGVSNIILQDDFTSPTLWNIATSDQASVQISNNRLTIAVQPGVDPVVTFRKDLIFANFYAEITAQPSLCRDADSYGLLFRAPNHVGYYRFALACNGSTSVDRVSLGRARVLHGPMLSGDVPLGSPGEVKLGVWAEGSQFHFFLNDRFQFTAADENYLAGGFGVFAQAGGMTPITITFTNLVVRQVDTQAPVETPTP